MDDKDDKHNKPEDRELFRDAVRGATPLKARRRHSSRPAPGPRARFRRRDEARVIEEAMSAGSDPAEVETGEELLFHRAQVPRTVLRRLRRGRYAIEDEIDLHGMTAEQARSELKSFLSESHAAGLRCVRVVHGKGLGSGPRGPVLKIKVNQWLQRWQEVAAFCSAPPVHGGTGAILVLLAR
jgi:DNA-nicking Smr family endonuclease